MIRIRDKHGIKVGVIKENNSFGESFFKIVTSLFFILTILLFPKIVADNFADSGIEDITHLVDATSGKRHNIFNFDQSLAEICESEVEKFEENNDNNTAQLYNSFNFTILSKPTLAVAQLFTTHLFLHTDLRILYCTFLL